MASNPYPGSNEDDLKTLDMMAAQGQSFEEAMEGWDGRMSAEASRKPYEDFLAFYKKVPGEPPVIVEPE
jgi:hypothetical protein